MSHRAFPTSGRQATRALAAQLALLGAFACGTPPAFAQAFDRQPMPAADRPRLPLTLDVHPSLPSTPAWQAGDDVGLSWRARLADDRLIDITAWRRIQRQPFDAVSQIRQRDPLYGARVEMKLTPARTRFATELRAIGLQLDNGARILLRRKNGNPTLYYRAQF